MGGLFDEELHAGKASFRKKVDAPWTQRFQCYSKIAREKVCARTDYPCVDFPRLWSRNGVVRQCRRVQTCLEQVAETLPISTFNSQLNMSRDAPSPLPHATKSRTKFIYSRL
jgi:hypothetical protein